MVKGWFYCLERQENWRAEVRIQCLVFEKSIGFYFARVFQVFLMSVESRLKLPQKRQIVIKEWLSIVAIFSLHERI